MFEDREELHRIEKLILHAKRELSTVSRERRSAAIAGETNKLMATRVRSIQKTLENCSLLVEYVRRFNKPIAREMQKKHDGLVKEFEHIREVDSPAAFHEWIRGNIAPVLKQTEQVGSLAATIVRKSQGERINFHRWVEGQTQ